MTIDQGLLERVREILEERPRISEKRMFGGMAFLCGGNLFLGVKSERLMVRVGGERYQEALALPGVRPMVHRGRGMTGYVFVDVAVLDEDAELERFVEWGAGVAAALPVKETTAEARKPKTRTAKASKPEARKPKTRTASKPRARKAQARRSRSS